MNIEEYGRWTKIWHWDETNEYRIGHIKIDDGDVFAYTYYINGETSRFVFSSTLEGMIS